MALSESVGESCEDIPIELDGSPGVIGFNTGYILDALRVIDSKYIKFSFSEPLSPGLLTMPEQEDFLYVVMPMSFDEKDYPNIVINDKSE
jgi:DNA polymerase-3 subunit beta